MQNSDVTWKHYNLNIKYAISKFEWILFDNTLLYRIPKYFLNACIHRCFCLCKHVMWFNIMKVHTKCICTMNFKLEQQCNEKDEEEGKLKLKVFLSF